MRIVDLSAQVRAKRRRCLHERTVSSRRGRVQTCVECGDRTPCHGCLHLDCVEARIAMGSREVMTRRPASVRVIDTATGALVFDLTDDDPVEWVLPSPPVSR